MKTKLTYEEALEIYVNELMRGVETPEVDDYYRDDNNYAKDLEAYLNDKNK